MGNNVEDIQLGLCFVRREQHGSIMVLTALMMVVLIGMVGLAIDVGHEMGVYRQTQNASDAAALAAAQSLNLQRGFAGNTTGFSASANAAKVLVQQNGCSGCTLQSLTYYSGNPDLTSNQIMYYDGTNGTWSPSPSGVAVSSVLYVKAQVSSSLPTYFIRVLGFRLSSVGTKAVGQVEGPGECAISSICVLSSTAHCALDVTGGAVVQITAGGVVDNSGYQNGGTGSLCVDNNASLQDAGGIIYNVGGVHCDTSSSATCANINPQPISSGHISDPLASLLPPSAASAAYCGSVDVTSSSNNQNGNNNCSTDSAGTCPPSNGHNGNSNSNTVYLCPGIYSEIHVESGGKVYLEPGIYFIFNGNGSAANGSARGLDVDAGGTLISVNNGPDSTPAYGLLDGGVMLYFTCGKTSGGGSVQPCTAKDNSNGVMSVAGGASVSLHGIDAAKTNPPYTVPPYYNPDSKYNGMLIFYDRQNYSNDNIEGNSSSSFTGTIYGVNANIQIGGAAAVSFGSDSRVIANTLKIDGGNQTGTGATFTMAASSTNNIPLQPSLGGLVR